MHYIKALNLNLAEHYRTPMFVVTNPQAYYGLMKHKHRGGYHIAKLIPFEFVGFGTVLAIMPKFGFIVGLLAASALTYATDSVFKGVRAVVRQVPTALGYSDYAAQSAKNTATNAKIDPAVLNQPKQKVTI